MTEQTLPPGVAAMAAAFAEDREPTKDEAKDAVVEVLAMFIMACATVERIAIAAESLAKSAERIAACEASGYFDVRQND